MGLILMSGHELQRIEVLSQVLDGSLRPATAAQVLGLSQRQVQRLIREVRADGAMAVRHKLRGRLSNNRISEPHWGCRRLQLLSRMEHHEQDNEQVFPRSA